ncbi:FAD-dependent monooxygenase [Streptomyces hiroshimensis]|uniref:FAD-dependent oxidoreductase n=1 Tax=Streptomyces hiroshimensis TaxID=66424 RepID=A0ABQ2YS61_9ACTN|nr:FAD-dependent monooxygenase [Streptomyces hiroshimensis]GGX93533.1 FAD-dependent oxidoreductase [Streptomyces hiroshimensis]
MKALICGGGIAGLALARCLGGHGWEVVVLEKADGLRTHGYMIDFFGPGYTAAEEMGLLPRLQELGYAVDALRYVDEDGRTRAGLSYERFAKAAGGRLISIMRPDLELALYESLPGKVDVRFGTGLTAVTHHPDGATATLTDGTDVAADVVVGADGVHSAVRGLAFGDGEGDRGAQQHGRGEPYVRRLGFHTAAFVFEDPGIHAIGRKNFVLTDTTDRQMGFYSLRDGRVAAFAVHRSADPALPDDPREALRREYGGLGWVVPRALRACPPGHEVYYDLVAQVEVPCWSRGRVTLVGDACYAVSLLAGQGASLGMAGAYLLAEQLAEAPSVGTALRRYEERWRPVVAEKQRAARRGVRWFLPGSQRELRLRRLALRAAALLPGADRYVATALAGRTKGVLRRALR